MADSVKATVNYDYIDSIMPGEVSSSAFRTPKPTDSLQRHLDGINRVHSSQAEKITKMEARLDELRDDIVMEISNVVGRHYDLKHEHVQDRHLLSGLTVWGSLIALVLTVWLAFLTVAVVKG